MLLYTSPGTCMQWLSVHTSCHASHQYIHTWDTEMLTCTPLHTYLLVHLTMYVSHHVSSAGRYIHDMRYIHHEIHTSHHVLIICTTHHQVVYTTWSAGSMYTSSSCTVHHVYQLLYLHTYHMIYIHMICCVHTYIHMTYIHTTWHHLCIHHHHLCI